MNVVKLLLLLTVCPLAASAATDREKIDEVMSCFFDWDINGGAERAKNCVSEQVLYHRVDSLGKHVTNTPKLDWEGKGKGAHEHNVLDVDIYDNMAVVKALLRYNPQSANNTYIKTFVLYRVEAGWRVTNVFWGRVTNHK